MALARSTVTCPCPARSAGASACSGRVHQRHPEPPI